MKRAVQILVTTHRYAGLVGALFFAMWFVSGVFMMYVEMPYFRQGAFASAGDPPLNTNAVRLTPTEAFTRSGLVQPPDRMRLAMLLERPVYRMLSAERDRLITIYADSGELLAPLSDEQAFRVVTDFARRLRAAKNTTPVPAPAAPANAAAPISGPQAPEAIELIDTIAVDQWTLYRNDFAAQRPFYRFAWRDGMGTQVYVSQASGKIVQMTSRQERLLAWAGPVLHWLYFASLRQHASLWSTTVLWISGGGMLVALSGFVLGFARLRRRAGSGRSYESPFRAPWFRWHHWLGLAFGLFVCTWIFSGWMSMTPMNWTPGTGATAEEVNALRGGPLRPELFDDFLTTSSAVIQSSLPENANATPGPNSAATIRELEFVQFAGKAHIRFVGYRPGPNGFTQNDIEPPIEAERLCAAAAALRPHDRMESCERLDEWDAYYYAKPGTRFQTKALPVFLASFASAQRHSYYLDPATGTIAQRYESRSRLNRWLYQGLHSFSLPALYQRRPLWDIVMLVLLAGGLGLSLTSIVLMLRKFKKRG